MTNANRMWCAACCTAVEAVVKEASATGLGALIGGGAGALHAGSRSRPSAGELLVRTVAYGLLGHMLESALVPAAQRLVCGRCGCSKLSVLSAR